MNAPAELALRLAQVVGPAAVLTEAADMAPYRTDWRGRYSGQRAASCGRAAPRKSPRSSRCCAESACRMVPQGGNTGLCGGATPDAAGEAGGA